MKALSTPNPNANAESKTCRKKSSGTVNIGKTKAATMRQRMKEATALAVYLWLHSICSARAFLKYGRAVLAQTPSKTPMKATVTGSKLTVFYSPTQVFPLRRLKLCPYRYTSVVTN
jgi:hypothetical protein